MAAITLREYVREIEKQVDGGRNEEAIAHSRHVLESFPRYVDIYRLLGKAYLESQRYGDAGDIFQRVLSAAPEDFVSHVGMSIIREDDGNLDEAIWHMERAFDVQPSNSAIQEELRRLYGRRDNIEPPKIRLTRGALARMYYKGELYLQAIAEVRAALNEAPDRLDLQALLAEIYAKAGQRAEAVEMAGQVLHKLPFCLAANQIMVELLIGTEKESKIETFFQRLSQLDPYAAQVTAAAPRAENVPDQAIRLNKLDYKARDTVEGGPSQPLWAATLGIEVAEMATGREESLPEWLAAEPSTGAGESELVGGAAVPAFAGDEAQAPAEGLVEPAGEEEQIPDWMKDLEWGPASEESLQTEAALQFEEEGPEAPAVEGELAKAEIPDWLQALAPAEVLAGAKAEDEDLSPWLDQLFSAEPEAGEAEARAGLSIMEGEAQGADWLAAGLALGAAAAGEAALGQEEETAEEAEMLGSEAVSEAAGEAAEEALPDWLAEISPEGEMAEVLPSWLFESEAAPGAEATVEAAAEEEAELPEWLFESEAAPGAEVMTEEETAEEAVELPEWLLEAAAVEQVETDEEGVEERAEEAEGVPDWLEAAGAVTGAAAGFKASDWLSEEEAPEEEAVLAAADLETEMEPAAEEWQAEAETVVVEDTLPSPAEIEAEAPAESAELEEAFAWLDSLLAPVKETVAAIEEPAPVKVVEEPMPGEAEAATPPQTPAAETPMDEDAAFAWLESLAVRQGAQEALLLKPEERSETPPEWLKAAAATAAAGAVLDKIGEEEGGPKEAVEEPVEPALPEAMEEPAFAESAEEAVEGRACSGSVGGGAAGAARLAGGTERRNTRGDTGMDASAAFTAQIRSE